MDFAHLRPVVESVAGADYMFREDRRAAGPRPVDLQWLLLVAHHPALRPPWVAIR